MVLKMQEKSRIKADRLLSQPVSQPVLKLPKAEGENKSKYRPYIQLNFQRHRFYSVETNRLEKEFTADMRASHSIPFLIEDLASGRFFTGVK